MNENQENQTASSGGQDQEGSKKIPGVSEIKHDAQGNVIHEDEINKTEDTESLEKSSDSESETEKENEESKAELTDATAL